MTGPLFYILFFMYLDFLSISFREKSDIHQLLKQSRISIPIAALHMEQALQYCLIWLQNKHMEELIIHRLT